MNKEEYGRLVSWTLKEEEIPFKYYFYKGMTDLVEVIETESFQEMARCDGKFKWSSIVMPEPRSEECKRRIIDVFHCEK